MMRLTSHTIPMEFSFPLSVEIKQIPQGPLRPPPLSYLISLMELVNNLMKRRNPIVRWEKVNRGCYTTFGAENCLSWAVSNMVHDKGCCDYSRAIRKGASKWPFLGQNVIRVHENCLEPQSLRIEMSRKHGICRMQFCEPTEGLRSLNIEH